MNIWLHPSHHSIGNCAWVTTTRLGENRYTHREPNTNRMKHLVTSVGLWEINAPTFMRGMFIPAQNKANPELPARNPGDWNRTHGTSEVRELIQFDWWYIARILQGTSEKSCQLFELPNIFGVTTKFSTVIARKSSEPTRYRSNRNARLIPVWYR